MSGATFWEYRDPAEWLECQDCGEALRLLSWTEQRHRAENPYDWVKWCRECWPVRKKELEENGIIKI